MGEGIGLIKDSMVGWTILLVEDDEDAIRITSRWFKLAGASLITAENGSAALDAARTYKPELIISDLHMPVMDGWGLSNALKSDSRTKDIPIIALSADHSSEARHRTNDAGFAGYMRKPLDPSKFLDVLVQVIQSIPVLAAKWDVARGNA